MATAAVVNTFVAATPAEAAKVNTNFNDLVTFLNNSVVHRDGSKAMTANFDAGTNKIVNLSAGTAATDAVTKAQLDAAATTGAWTTYVPVLTQSSTVTHTVTRAKYARFGRTIFFEVVVIVTGTGTASNQVVVSLPVTAASSGFITAGGGYITDVTGSPQNYHGLAYLASTTTVGLSPTVESAGALGLLGQVYFSAALGSGDGVNISGVYEAAS